MARPPLAPTWEDWYRDIGTADWFIWTAIQRIQQASRELAILSYEMSYFEDSFAMQLAQLQQHARTPPRRRSSEGPTHAVLVERAQTMIRISRMLDRAIYRLGEQSRSLERMTDEALQVAHHPQQDPQGN